MKYTPWLSGFPYENSARSRFSLLVQAFIPRNTYFRQVLTHKKGSMRFHFVATLPILFCVGTSADPGSYNGSGSDSNNAGHDAGVVYLPVESLQNELLNSTGLDPESLVAVATSYEVMKDESPGLAGVTSANSNVVASVLIIPSKNRTVTTTKASDTIETAPADELSGRIQLMYNCTSEANLWNMQDDPNVLRLDNFQLLSTNASSDSLMAGNVTEEVRKIVAIASVEFTNCAGVRETAVGRPVVGNAFFSADFSTNPAFFYTVSSGDIHTSGSGNCLLRLEMVRANLTEVYPNCKISFQSTDFDNVIHSNDVTASSAEGRSKTRRLEMGTYIFVKDQLCSYECGVDAEPDECLVDLGNNKYVTMECQLQFFKQNPGCDSECGDAVSNLQGFADQCYQCESDIWGGCDSGYVRADWNSCCKPLTCDPVEDTTVGTPTELAWNLKSDGTIINPSYVIYQGGDCSNPYNLSSTWCRITCENCFVGLSLASFYADVDAIGIADYSTTAEMKLTGASVLWVKVFAPSGCTLESTNNIIDVSANKSIGYGVSATINMKLDILKRLALKPHGTSAEFGAITEITDITTGYIDSKQFFDVEMNKTPSRAALTSILELLLFHPLQ